MALARNHNIVEELPNGLTVERHVLLEGRTRHPWYRRALMGLVCVIPVLALLDVFGQWPATTTAHGAAATMRLQAPERVRGGLMWQGRFDIEARTTIKEPQITLGPGWWDEMTQNSINPQPVASSTSNGRVTLSYGRLNPGQKLTVWIQFQVNPAHVGRQEANALLTNGPDRLAQINRTITVLP